MVTVIQNHYDIYCKEINIKKKFAQLTGAVEYVDRISTLMQDSPPRKECPVYYTKPSAASVLELCGMYLFIAITPRSINTECWIFMPTVEGGNEGRTAKPTLKFRTRKFDMEEKKG